MKRIHGDNGYIVPIALVLLGLLVYISWCKLRQKSVIPLSSPPGLVVS